jgi:5-methyltetrahydrofolate--homocysteine methyltransferase
MRAHLGYAPAWGWLQLGPMRRHKLVRARELRANATPAERFTWSILRNRGVLGHKFRRQQVLYGFIADFFCAELKLAIELDGAVHDEPERQGQDAARDEALELAGIRTVRLKNNWVSRALLTSIVESIGLIRARERTEGIVPPLHVLKGGSGRDGERSALSTYWSETKKSKRR